MKQNLFFILILLISCQRITVKEPSNTDIKKVFSDSSFIINNDSIFDHVPVLTNFHFNNSNFDPISAFDSTNIIDDSLKVKLLKVPTVNPLIRYSSKINLNDYKFLRIFMFRRFNMDRINIKGYLIAIDNLVFPQKKLVLLCVNNINNVISTFEIFITGLGSNVESELTKDYKLKIKLTTFPFDIHISDYYIFTLTSIMDDVTYMEFDYNITGCWINSYNRSESIRGSHFEFKK